MLARLGFSLVVWSSNFAFVHAQSQSFEQVVKTSPGGELTLDLESGGSVNLHGWAQNTVRVRAHLAGRDWRDTQVTAEATPRGVRVHSWLNVEHASSSTSHTFDIWVPRRYDLTLSSAGGRLTIADVEGTFRGALGGGMITIERARGRAELSTGGGAIHVADSDLAGSVTTGGGSVSLRRVTGGLRAWAE
jgi:hypothetical protein